VIRIAHAAAIRGNRVGEPSGVGGSHNLPVVIVAVDGYAPDHSDTCEKNSAPATQGRFLACDTSVGQVDLTRKTIVQQHRSTRGYCSDKT
jgi:hypothetical protein